MLFSLTLSNNAVANRHSVDTDRFTCSLVNSGTAFSNVCVLDRIIYTMKETNPDWRLGQTPQEFLFFRHHRQQPIHAVEIDFEKRLDAQEKNPYSFPIKMQALVDLRTEIFTVVYTLDENESSDWATYKGHLAGSDFSYETFIGHNSF